MDGLVRCPYDKSHVLSPNRLQSHLVKCEKNHPPLAECRYDATHRAPASEMDRHESECPAKMTRPAPEALRADIRPVAHDPTQFQAAWDD